MSLTTEGCLVWVFASPLWTLWGVNGTRSGVCRPPPVPPMEHSPPLIYPYNSQISFLNLHYILPPHTHKHTNTHAHKYLHTLKHTCTHSSKHTLTQSHRHTHKEITSMAAMIIYFSHHFLLNFLQLIHIDPFWDLIGNFRLYRWLFLNAGACKCNRNKYLQCN